MSTNDTRPKMWMITGASSGIGHSLAERVLGRGDRALLIARNVSALDKIVALHPDRAASLSLDLSDTATVSKSLARYLMDLGPIDVLVNNAGHMLLGGVEEASETQIRDIFEINFFAAISMMKAVLPGMRARRSGHVINVTSAAAYSGGPGTPYYAATKSALTAVSESLHAEAAHLGIKVTLVEPGSHRTAIRHNWKIAQPIEDYAESVAAIHAIFMAGAGSEPGDPDLAADAILCVADATEPPLHLPLGQDAVDRAKTKIASLEREFSDWHEVILSTRFARPD